jgi:hypothetical protein
MTRFHVLADLLNCFRKRQRRNERDSTTVNSRNLMFSLLSGLGMMKGEETVSAVTNSSREILSGILEWQDKYRVGNSRTV